MLWGKVKDHKIPTGKNSMKVLPTVDVVEIIQYACILPDSPDLTIKSTVKYRILLLNSLWKLNRQLQTYEEKSIAHNKMFYQESLKLKTPTIIYYVYHGIMKQSHTKLST